MEPVLRRLDSTERTGPYGHDYAAYKASSERLPQTFDLVEPDTGALASALADAGVRYAVLPTKHQDGFFMWDTDETDYEIPGSSCAYPIQLNFRQVLPLFAKAGSILPSHDIPKPPNSGPFNTAVDTIVLFVVKQLARRIVKAGFFCTTV